MSKSVLKCVVKPNSADDSTALSKAISGAKAQDTLIVNGSWEAGRQDVLASPTVAPTSNPILFGVVPAETSLTSLTATVRNDQHVITGRQGLRELECRGLHQVYLTGANEVLRAGGSWQSTLGAVNEPEEYLDVEDRNSNCSDDHQREIDLAHVPTLSSRRACAGRSRWSPVRAISKAMRAGRSIVDMFNERPMTLTALQRMRDDEILAQAGLL